MIAALHALQSMGYAISLDHDNIVLGYSGDALPDTEVVAPLVAEIREHKSAIVALLKTDSLFGWEAVENHDTTYQRTLCQFFTQRPDECYACGSTDFWDKGGQQICNVCHPKPRIP